MLGTISSNGLIWVGVWLDLSGGIAALKHLLRETGDILTTETGVRLLVT